MVREWILRLFGVVRRGPRDRQVDDELRFHLEQLTDAYRRRGFDPGAAREAAEREFGGVAHTKQAWRDQRTLLPLEELIQHVRYRPRMLRRSPGAALLASATPQLTPRPPLSGGWAWPVGWGRGGRGEAWRAGAAWCPRMPAATPSLVSCPPDSCSPIPWSSCGSLCR